MELKNRKHTVCGGIKAESLCGTKFQNEHWDAVKMIVIQHTNDLNYVVSTYSIKLFTLEMLSHPIWSNVEIPEVKVDKVCIQISPWKLRTRILKKKCIHYINFETCRFTLKRNNRRGKGRHVTLTAILIWWHLMESKSKQSTIFSVMFIMLYIFLPSSYFFYYRN